MADKKFPETRAEGIAPAELPGFKAKYNQTWGLQPGEGAQDSPGNDLNKPVPLRKGGPDENGWMHEAYDVNQTEEV